jgi:hypothetical protein
VILLCQWKDADPDPLCAAFQRERAEKIPVTVENGELRISCDTSKLRHGTMFFELVYE